MDNGYPARVALFCGSSQGNDPVYATRVAEAVRVLVDRGVEIVFGGGHVGLMGVVADTALEAGGRVTGVMPRSLVEREIAHADLSTLHVVESMHERKALMAELSDGFLALPGGAGTLEEIAEQWTWAQLGIHDKPCGFLDVNGFFDPLREMITRMRDEGFCKPEHTEMVFFASDVDEALRYFAEYTPPGSPKWIPKP